MSCSMYYIHISYCTTVLQSYVINVNISLRVCLTRMSPDFTASSSTHRSSSVVAF